MRVNTNDPHTLQKNYLRQFSFLIKEYEEVKKKEHNTFKFVKEFYEHYHIDKRTFVKYYGRYKQSKNKADLLPQKRGPKYKTRRPLPLIENKVIELRLLGNNRYEISSILKPKLKKATPSPSGVYNILRRNNLNRLTPKMKTKKRKIIKTLAGELGHVDCHYLAKGTIKDHNKRLYLVCVIDSCTRIAWAEVVEDIKALTVMFATLKSINLIKAEYDIKFKEIITDNGSEFGGGKQSKNKYNHPFERMLMELGIKHRYTRPYRPQTNGKVERFWRTIESDLLEDTYFDSIEELKDEVIQYLVYYNHERPHSGINNIAPAKFNKNCPRIT